MDPATAKTQIVERIKGANSILVTVSTNPTVDQLAACIGLTLLLNKLEKHATAVFSGQVPSTLEYLQPEKTIETSTDSLRDFIISLDKEKADKLRYKIEDQFVRIYITPYKTSLSEKDLTYSQGDFNVQAVIAVGIKDKGHIDAAVSAHGKILHDATVITMNTGTGKAPDLGQINWQDGAASSLCEMVGDLATGFGGGLMDGQMATALLTGIVAETQRFSNSKTSAKVMTLSAQLMAAGANQQLIVSKLEAPVVQAPKLAAEPKVALPKSLPQDGVLAVEHKPQPGPKLSATLKQQAEKPAAPKPVQVQTGIQNEAQTETSTEEINIDSEGNIYAAGSTPPASPPPDGPNNHELLNPKLQSYLDKKTFTASAEQKLSDQYSDPSLDPSSSGTSEAASPPDLYGRGRTINPKIGPAITGSATPPQASQLKNSAQEPAPANDSALSAPFDPAFVPPADALNETPLETGQTAVANPAADTAMATAPPFPPPLSPDIVAPAPGGITGTAA